MTDMLRFKQLDERAVLPRRGSVVAAGLEGDIEFAAELDKFQVVGRVDGERLVVSL